MLVLDKSLSAVYNISKVTTVNSTVVAVYF